MSASRASVAGAPIAALAEARPRAIVDAVLPAVDCGRFAVKRVVGEPLLVEAHCFADGHDRVRAVLRWRREGDKAARETEMRQRSNDEWFAALEPDAPGRYFYTVVAWVDHFVSWREDFACRVDRADMLVAAQAGAQLIEDAAGRARGAERTALKAWAAALQKEAKRASDDTSALQTVALDPQRALIAERYPDRRQAATFLPELPLWVDREKAAFSSWYELFPRSTADGARHGTFADVEARLPYVAALGFDVLYLPPIHPIGRVHRKGKNNALVAEADDVGSPWAIGAAEGGHKDILAELGTLDDFRRLVAAAQARGIEIALDIAFQCAPDHPYVLAHPQWFRKRPDGSIQYAENPPKKYQDIYPFDFESDDWAALWRELKSVFDHWIAQGVRIFRVDNPHTKSFAFWEWAIAAIHEAHPDVLFLAEAFTRPKIMHRLAKLGFSQSYTYFTWRHSGAELREYFEELSAGPGRDYFRPNVWPNTPDILNEQLHGAGRPMFAIRLVLAATLASNFGIYGPAFELMENTPRTPGSEEYLDSEKYQLRQWDLGRTASLRELIARLNRIRKDNGALQRMAGLRFLATDNEQLLACVRRTSDGANVLLVVVNLDAVFRQSGWVELDPLALPFDIARPYFLHDLLSDQRFVWQGGRGFVVLDPLQAPAHVFRLEARAPELAGAEATP
jgi:starch synthase (maltosyl-transferring)